MTRKRSVLQVQKFVGWPYLENLVAKAQTPRDKGLVATLFNTGGRASEVLALKKEHFSFEKIQGRNYVIVTEMPVLKKYKKVTVLGPDGFPLIHPMTGKPEKKTENVPTFRTFAINATEPLVKPMLQYLLTVKPGQYLFRLTRQGVWYVVHNLDPDIWVHWFRSQRASQLAVEYNFDVQQLLEWFRWVDVATAVRYSRLGYRALAGQMKK